MTAPRPSAADFSAAGFRTSSYTNGSGQCVEVSGLPDWTAVRDTKNRAGGAIVISRTTWNQFLAAITSSNTSLHV